MPFPWPFTLRRRELEQLKTEQVYKSIQLQLAHVAQADRALFGAWKQYVTVGGGETILRALDLMRRDLGVSGLGPRETWERFKKSYEAQGKYPYHRLRELIIDDLARGGIKPVAMPNPTPRGDPEMAGNPGGPGPGGGGQAQVYLPESIGEKIVQAQARVNDVFQAVEVAEQMGARLQEISSAYLSQIAQLMASMSEITGYVTEMDRKLATQPDFRAWSEQLNTLVQSQEKIASQGEQLIKKTAEIIEVLNKNIETVNRWKEELPKALLGRLEEWLDRELKIRLSELVTANNRIVELLEEEKERTGRRVGATTSGRL